MADSPIPRRRWLRYSLRTLFVVVGVCGTAGYWLAREAAVHRARDSYTRLANSCDLGIIAPQVVCEASLQLFQAEVSVPFANHRQAATAHLERLETLREHKYGPLSEWRMGVRDDKDLAEALALKAEVDRYFTDALRAAAETR